MPPVDLDRGLFAPSEWEPMTGKIVIVAVIWLSLSACVFTQAALGGGIVTDSPAPGMVQNKHSPRPPTQAAPTPPPESVCIVFHTQGLSLNVRACPNLDCPIISGLLPGEVINLGTFTPGDSWYPLESGGYIYSEFCEVIP